MNMQSLVVAAFGLSTFALAACTVSTTGSSGTTGAGGSSATTGAGGTSGVGGETSGVGGGVGGGGVGGGASCVTCGTAITPGGNPDGLAVCDGNSGTIYDTLVACTCMGACATDCGDNVCAMKDVSATCQTCLQDAAGGCGKEFNDCANDI